MRQTLIRDITPARTKWEKQYAKMEYQRIVWHDLWSPTTYIPIITPPENEWFVIPYGFRAKPKNPDYDWSDYERELEW